MALGGWWGREGGGRKAFSRISVSEGVSPFKRKYVTAFKMLLSWKLDAFAEVVYQNFYTNYKQSRNVHYLPFHQFETEAAGGKGCYFDFCLSIYHFDLSKVSVG